MTENGLYEFLSMLKSVQPCTQSSMEFRGNGRYKSYIPFAFKRKLIENDIYKNEAGEKLISITPLGEKILSKEIDIKAFLEDI